MPSTYCIIINSLLGNSCWGERGREGEREREDVRERKEKCRQKKAKGDGPAGWLSWLRVSSRHAKVAGCWFDP